HHSRVRNSCGEQCQQQDHRGPHVVSPWACCGGERRNRKRSAMVRATAASENSTGGYPNLVKRTPAPAVATEATSALQNSVMAAAALRSASGVSFINRL